MHVKIFELAKGRKPLFINFDFGIEELESKHNINVVGGFLSPSHDNYVKGKLGKNFLHSRHRFLIFFWKYLIHHQK